MQTFVALIRGINVGGHRAVPMAPLRAALAEAGFARVASYIQSGNLVLDADAGEAEVAREVAGIIEREFGHTVSVLVRGADELRRALAGNPFGEGDPAQVTLWFAAEPFTAADAALVAEASAASGGRERAELSGRELYVDCGGPISGSTLTAELTKTLGRRTTVRNLRTVAALVGLLNAPV